MDESSMHIKQEGHHHNPEGGKLSRLIKNEMIEGPTEHDTEDSGTIDESQGQDSCQEEDMAEDLSMAPDILGGSEA